MTQFPASAVNAAETPAAAAAATDSSLLQQSFANLRDHMNRAILGQPQFVERLLLAVLADGHLLVEGAPGLAKTKAIKVLASAIECDEHRIQFTPDLLPSDLTGTDIYRPEDGSFRFQKGPIFHHLVLADEINRAPAKVQSALLEAMAERQVTVGATTYPLPPFFLVMATQNPIEQEGTYPLPEAQLDRFLMHVQIGYPDLDAERQILKLVRGEALGEAPLTQPLLTLDQIFAARIAALNTYMADGLQEYLLQLILATREPHRYGADLAGAVAFGASPRGTIALDRLARAHAWLQGRDFVTPADLQAVAKDALRHRILLNFEAEADGMSRDRLLDLLLQRVPVS